MSAWLSVAITVILVVVAYVILNRNINARTSQQAALDEIKREVGAIITELNSTTERNIELIEDRIATLETLIQQADKRVGALRRDAAVRGSEQHTYSQLRRPGPASSGESGADRPEGGNARSAAGRQDNGRPGADQATEGSAGSGSDGRRSLRERVRGLYLQGLSLERIASIVGKTVGEVELIVSLDEGTER
jgi:hypothetical protein